ncbi:MAG: hormogonium polysaccharide secretion pseudopilin HpsC [Pseudanabaena sp.]|jgi:prepilin-type N-terminal cleavage/methylation domain-containing protein
MMFSIRKFIKQNLSKKVLHFRNVFSSGQVKRLLNKKLSFASKQSRNRMLLVRGFTLIELLVAMLIATLIISTLLTFVISIVDIDRREQAKVESQGEVQAALDYIADDMQEAVYVYNADGMTQLTTIPAQLPTFADSTPILAFWKRIYYAPDEIPKGGARLTGCIEFDTDSNCDSNTTLAGIQPKGGGRYVYALVVYYLIYDNSNGANSAWSNASRIGRWEIRDGIRATCQNTDETTCPAPVPTSRVAMTASLSINYWTPPDPGFKLFDSGGSNKETIMNSWKKAVASYDPANTPKERILIDFIDDTPYTSSQDDGTVGNSLIDIVIAPNLPAVSGVTPNNPSCSDPSIGVGGSSTQTTQRVPGAFQTTSTNKAENLSSFYVCVNSTEFVARIFMRGNALARLRPNQTEGQRSITNENSTFLTTSNVRVFGRGKLFF